MIDVVGCFFYVDDVWYVSEVQCCFVCYVCDCLVWYVVQDYWQVDCFGDCLEVVVYVFLCWFVVVWYDLQCCVCVDGFCMFCQFDCFGG